MPIVPHRPVSRISQDEFREIAYTVMGHLFEIHREFGRFFNEGVYKEVLAARMPDVDIEFPIAISHGSFSTKYFVDAMIADSVPFEFKAATDLVTRHRGQLYNYLLLLDLEHGKLVNMRSQSVDHEFVNATLRAADRHAYTFVTDRWNQSLSCARRFQDLAVSLLEDWGAGPSIEMYEAALTHLLGGEDKVVQNVSVRVQHTIIGKQTMRLADDRVAFKLTSFSGENHHFEKNARRLLQHLDLDALLWINIALDEVTFRSIEKEELKIEG